MISTRILAYAIIISLGFSTGYSYAELFPKTLTELYSEHKLVLAGKVISVSTIHSQNLTKYDIQVYGVLSEPKSYSDITVFAPVQIIGNTTNPHFDIGDFVQLYLDKQSIGYIVSPYSFKIDESCRGLGPNVSTTPHYPFTNPIRLLNANSNVTGIASVNRELIIWYDGINDTPMNKTNVTISVKHNDDPVPVFHANQQLGIKPCVGQISLRWNFIPQKIGNYTIELTQMGGLYDNKIIFGNTTFNYSFSVNQNKTTAILSTPLKQYQSGISLENIQCKEGLHLVIKAKDSSPACVKPETSKMLVERGWAKSI